MERRVQEDQQDFDLCILCPVTAKLVKTGFVMSLESFTTAKLRNNAFDCLECGNRHVWRKRDVLLRQVL